MAGGSWVLRYGRKEDSSNPPVQPGDLFFIHGILCFGLVIRVGEVLQPHACFADVIVFYPDEEGPRLTRWYEFMGTELVQRYPPSREAG